MLKVIFLLLSKCPLRLLHALGAGLGWLVYTLSVSYRQKIERHVAVALGSGLLPPNTQPAALGRACAMHSGMALLELPFVWGRPTAQGIGPCTQVRGWEHVQAAVDKGQGVLLLTPHLGAFEVCAQVCALRGPITVLYRPHRRADVQALLEHYRGRDNLALAPTNVQGVKRMLKALRAGQAVGMLPDQVPGSGEGVWAPMFGKPAYSMVLPGRLVQATGARLVVAVGLRLPRGQGFAVEFSPGPLVVGNTPEAAAQAINQAMEAVIAQHPEQYYWGYERYRHPKGG